MALHKPTSGTYRLTGDSLNLAAGPRTFCCWVKWDSFDTSSTLWDDRLTGADGGGGLIGILNSPADDTKYMYNYVDTAGTTRRVSSAHNTSVGVWAFWAVTLVGTVTPAANFRTNATTAGTTGVGTPGVNSSNLSLFAAFPTGASPGEAAMSDFRIYNRILSDVELDCIYHCQGSDSIINGLVMRLPFLNGAPGTTTATTLPKDLANPGRVFTVAGTGTALTWTDSPYPKRRRS